MEKKKEENLPCDEREVGPHFFQNSRHTAIIIIIIVVIIVVAIIITRIIYHARGGGVLDL